MRLEGAMDFDREIDHYEVKLEDFVSSIGRYRHYATQKFDTEETAVDFAQKHRNDFRVTVRVIENIVGW